MDYETLLEKAYKSIPDKVHAKERWEPPVVESYQQGNQTVIRNANEIANKLRRDVQHIMKFFIKELATSGNYDNGRIILQGRFTDKQLNARLSSYIKEYVLCTECHKPDTTLITFEGAPYKRCEVCGARSPVKKL
ncbi:translation initiation factor IF-2 subunit beta [Candidatus Micrarchaeota archaeon]|nr:MAG: translation initiation factor IF-2 subunit beta [Candidatus Micrarchaeota archaeon]